MKIALVQQQATKDCEENLNRAGREEVLHFAGESFAVDPFGCVIARAPQGKDYILFAECDLSKIKESPAKRHFLRDRRPDFYRFFNLLDKSEKN